MIDARNRPVRTSGAIGWLRGNLFNSVLNSIISVVVIGVLLWAVYGLANFVFFGAHWGRVWANMKLFAVYRYPFDLLWRPLAIVALIMGLLGMTAGVSSHAEGEIIRGVFWWVFTLVVIINVAALFAWGSVRLLWTMVTVASLVGYGLGRAQPRLVSALPWLWGASLLVGYVLLSGVGSSGQLRKVPNREWGGFLLTLILSVVGIVVSFPLGIALALGRRSKLPAIKYFCIGFIEIVRGAPLIMWLFIASLMVPLIFNIDTSSVDALTKALVAVTLFSAAYMAENVRGGLQAVGKGQEEAARALGLSAWQTMRQIVLPQALRAVIPAIVGQSIGLFKDTSLVFVVGLFDFFNVANVVANQPQSLTVPGGIRLELSLFLAVIYWFFAFRMSVASRQLEKQLGVGTR